MKYEAIRRYSQEFEVGKMCRVLDLTRGGYTQWWKREKRREANRLEDQEILDRMSEIFKKSRKTYGYRRMWREMQEEGFEITEHKVRKMMKSNGIYPITRNKYKPGQKGKKTGQYFENIVAQEFMPKGFNEVWVGDITYIKTKLGWVYMAIVMDLYNREIIGYSISKNIDTELAKRALSNAMGRQGSGNGTIFHSDRGAQYCSKGFQAMLLKHGFVGSMSKSGCPYDNACAESFFSTAKKECIYRKEYATLEEVKADLFDYIEVFYNRKRMHKTLGYKSPVTFRLQKSA